MQPRDVTEQHRVATSLELLFDLIFVVASASAGQQLHHAIIENHLMQACHCSEQSEIQNHTVQDMH